jgi:ADP-heptose:LPS heptosyltransferase
MINKLFYKIYLSSQTIIQRLFFWSVSKFNINNNKNTLFFFHWGLGDFLIVSKFVEIYIKNNNSQTFFATASKNNYQYLIETKMFKEVILINPPWTNRSGKYNLLRNLFFFYNIRKLLNFKSFNIIFSIRNDPRDLFLSKYLKPNTIVSSSHYGLKDSIDIDIGMSEMENKYTWNEKLLEIFNLENENKFDKLELKSSLSYDIFIHTGSNDPSKNLPTKKIIELLNSINTKKNKIIIYTSKDNFNVFSNFMNIFLKDYDKTNLKELKQDILNSDNIIVNDSGPMHLAHKLGKKSISIWGSTTPEYWKPPSTIPIFAEISCRPCKYDCIYETYKCLDMIDTGRILKNLKIK